MKKLLRKDIGRSDTGEITLIDALDNEVGYYRGPDARNYYDAYMISDGTDASGWGRFVLSSRNPDECFLAIQAQWLMDNGVELKGKFVERYMLPGGLK